MSNDQTIVTLARDVSRALVAGERDNTETGWSIRVLRDDAPEWMRDVVRAGHGDMMPDDWRYEMIEEVLDAIAELDDNADDNEVSDAVAGIEPSIHTSNLTRWLASHVARVGYVDEAQNDGLVSPSCGLVARLQMGQLAEYAEIGSAVVTALTARLDEVSGW